MELHAEHLQLLLTLTDEAAPLWETIGLELGFTYSEISWIASKPLRTPEGTLGYYREMIAQWLQWGTLSHPLPTVEALTSALRKAGREQLALQIESEKGCGVVAIIYLFLVLAEGGSLSLYIQTLVTYGTLPPEQIFLVCGVITTSLENIFCMRMCVPTATVCHNHLLSNCGNDGRW